MYTHIFSDVPQLNITNFSQLSLKDLSVALLFITFFVVQFSRCNVQSLLKPDRNVQSFVRFHPFSIRNGGDSRDRTGDLLLARQALSQLSYIPISALNFLRKIGRFAASALQRETSFPLIIPSGLRRDGDRSLPISSIFVKAVGGPEWARTTDLTIISRTL